jgi:hypothetical protein
MKTHLLRHLTACASAYGHENNLSQRDVAALALGDRIFFERVENPEKTFTIRTYDRGMLWFSKAWPATLNWPHDVPRPHIIQSLVA